MNYDGKSDLEAHFDNQWRVHGGLPLKPEHKFHPRRRWRFDRCDPVAMVAVELEGGVYSGGRHVRGKGFEEDCEKYNEAQALGWLVFRLTRGMLEQDPTRHLGLILSCLAPRRLAQLGSEEGGDG